MANDWETAVTDAAEQLAHAIKDAAVLSIETVFTEAAAAGAPQTDVLALTTNFKPDGDSLNKVPVHTTPAGLVVDTALYEIHLHNVTAALEYRTQLLNALLNAVQARSR